MAQSGAGLMRQPLGHIIARRKYFRLGDEGASTVLAVEIGAPTQSPLAKNEFMCSYHFTFAGSEWHRTAYGIDELQALQLALGDLYASLRRLEGSAGLKLCWSGEETGGLGLRIPNFFD